MTYGSWTIVLMVSRGGDTSQSECDPWEGVYDTCDNECDTYQGKYVTLRHLGCETNMCHFDV
jgi:hypothetical protein